MKLAEARDHAFSLAWAEAVLARSLLLEGRYAEVEWLATRTIELCRRHGFAAREAACLLTRAAALVARGDTTVGVPELRDAVAGWMAVAGSAVHTLAQAAGSLIARSERILRSSAMLDLSSAATRREYEMPSSRAAALMRVIQRPRKSGLRLRR